MSSKTKVSLKDRLAGKKPVTATHVVVLDHEPMRAVEEAENAHRTARLFGVGSVEETERKLAEAKAAAEAAEASVTLHLQGLPRDAYEALILAHPPSKEQKAEQQTYDVDTFSPAVVALCIVEEGGAQPLTANDVRELSKLNPAEQREYLADTGRPMSPEDLQEAWVGWNQGEQGTLYQAALSVCTQARNPSLPFG